MKVEFEVRPCPFCGAQYNSIIEDAGVVINLYESGEYHLGCRECGALGQHDKNLIESVKKWNDRLTDRNEKIYLYLLAFQGCDDVHPLTCGNDSEHTLLIPRIDDNEDVVLSCLDCNYVQKKIPLAVIDIGRNIVDGKFKKEERPVNDE